MPRITRKLIVIIPSILCFALFAKIHPIHAQLSAESIYKVNIDVTSQKDVSIEYDISLTNKSSTFFIRDYSLLLDQTDLVDLQVLENGVPANFRKQPVGDKVQIKILFINTLLNLDDSVNLVIKYKTNELCIGQGKIIKIFIPPIKTEETLMSCTFSLTIPESLGDVAYNSMPHKTLALENGQRKLEFLQDEALKGVLLIIGSEQQFEFKYTYKLSNTDLTEKMMTLTLPPESVYQDVYFLTVSLTPDKTFTDANGNILAMYKLQPNESKDIEISGYTVFHDTQDAAESENLTKKYALDKTQIWDYGDDKVRSLLNTITRKDYSPYENTELIYDYLVNTYKYFGSEGAERKSAASLISISEAQSCQNITDLFVTLARAIGVSTREVVGVFVRGETFEGEQYWAEFFDQDKGKWIIADPCLDIRGGYYSFDNLDVSRFILAYRSAKDDYPEVVFPFIHYQQSETDNLVVSLSDYNFDKAPTSIDFDYSVGKGGLFSSAIPVSFTVTNNSDRVFWDLIATIRGRQVGIEDEALEDDLVEAVFPKQTVTFNGAFILDAFAFLGYSASYDLKITAQVGKADFQSEDSFSLGRYFSIFSIGVWLLAIGAAMLTLALLYLMRRYIKKLKWKKKKRTKKYHLKGSRLRGFLND